MENKKTAIVLSGGGAKGGYQVGVMKQLTEKGIKPDFLIGTSIGAINSALYAHVGMSGLEKMWLSIKGPCDTIYPVGIQWLWNFWRYFYSTGFRKTKTQDILTEAIQHAPTCEALACYVDLVTGQTLYKSNKECSKEEFIDAVVSSGAIPMLLEPHKNGVDGGVTDHTPIGKAIDLGAEIIYVIVCRPRRLESIDWALKSKWFGWYKVLQRSVDEIMASEILFNDLKTALLVNKYAEAMGKKKVEIHAFFADRWWMDTLEFDPKKIKAAYYAGYTAQEESL